ncbi:flagellar protein FlgN [Bacillus massiliglaciei]|uniref:flagellar protein FlgN n=1 Tax=Bacillus massiliglaciei TaxID=1816693 RepID=UPI000DA63E00|nr:flagellar protein FlgN [Bacillus massiliglaciei]
MSTQHIADILKKMIMLHSSLNALAEKKTGMIKEGKTDALTALLMNEQKHIKAISQTETERESAVKAFLRDKGIHRTAFVLDDVIDAAEQEEAALLTGLKTELLGEMMKLKEQNDLNQQLIYQSLQFVNLNLDLLQPQRQTDTYDHKMQSSKGNGRSMFDSKA